MRQKLQIFTVLFISALVGWLSGSFISSVSKPETVAVYSTDYTALGLPFRKAKATTGENVEVVPLGLTIGVRINTDGVMVLGTGSFLGEDGKTHTPSNGILRGGDLIIKIDDEPIESKEALSRLVAESTGDINLLLRREGSEFEVTLTPSLAATDGVRRIGIWVRDSTKGIGTLTYYIPETAVFGALGHGIIDVDTKKLIAVRNGKIMPSIITSIVKGARGNPGELEGTVDTDKSLGNVNINSPSGIFGVLDETFIKTLPTQTMPIATRDQIVEGPATILTNVVNNTVKSYDIMIEGVNRNPNDETKGMIIRITDPDLLAATNGIVQGMSGSPIIQNGHVVGAITHVFVQDPAKGYGIFIETMLAQNTKIPHD